MHLTAMITNYAQMNPPLRDKSHYDRLWYAVRNNYNDTIGSDHAPHLKVNKDKDILIWMECQSSNFNACNA